MNASDSPGCRFCGAPLSEVVDLGMSPLCESFLTQDRLNHMEAFYPLRVLVCQSCFLMQLEKYVEPSEIFSEYAYFSSFSDSYLDHARLYVEKIIPCLGLTESTKVVELASNDGYLLRHFVAHNIPALGIEPASNVARAAMAKGIPTMVAFFGEKLAQNLEKADLVIANNVLAQVPDINDFVAGLKMLLAPSGVATIEFPHLLRLIEGNQYDTIYHEHFSYFSLTTAERIFTAHGLQVFDAEEIWTHGGSLRLYLRHQGHELPIATIIARIKDDEQQAGLDRLQGFSRFAVQVRQSKWNLIDFLIRTKWYGKSIVAYGAPGKGNTLLNYAGIRGDIIDYAVDRNPYKHGRFTPGTHIPITAPERIRETRPDYLLILPWNLKDEIMAANGYIRDWGGQFIIPIPDVTVFP